MNQNQLASICSPQYILTDRVVLIPPSEFKKMEGQSLHDCRLLILVNSGHLTLLINGKEYKMHACSLLDLLNWAYVRIVKISPDLKAYCILPTYEFTNESLNGLKPGPENYFQERLYLPIISISENENILLERQIQALETALSNLNHYYRQELVQTHFKIFLLELGNIMLMHQKKSNKSLSIIGKRDIIVIGFLKLVWKYFKTEHNIDFYASRLNISPKHLSRTVKAMLGKTPHEVICNELLQYAVTLLKNNQLSILEISTSLQFSEQAAFCKFFKKHTGVAPREYRKNSCCI